MVATGLICLSDAARKACMHGDRCNTWDELSARAEVIPPEVPGPPEAQGRLSETGMSTLVQDKERKMKL